MLKREQHKKKECGYFMIECSLDIRLRLLGMRMVKGAN